MRDLEIRAALRRRLEFDHHDDSETMIVDELGLREGAVRADVAVINGSLSGFEIKSDQDTLKRLPKQAEVYSQVFDFVTIIVGEKHREAAKSTVPAWWGIASPVERTGTIEFEFIRSARRNPDVDLLAVASLLWRSEALKILEARGLETGLKSKPRRILWARLVEVLEAAELSNEVRCAVRARKDWRVGQARSRCDG